MVARAVKPISEFKLLFSLTIVKPLFLLSESGSVYDVQNGVDGLHPSKWVDELERSVSVEGILGCSMIFSTRQA